MTDAERLHQRITELERTLGSKLDQASRATNDIAQSVAAIVAQCGICGKTVMGNGKPPLGERVSQLETLRSDFTELEAAQQRDHDAIVRLAERDETRVRIGWKGLTAMIAIVSATIALVQVLMRFIPALS